MIVAPVSREKTKQVAMAALLMTALSTTFVASAMAKDEVPSKSAPAAAALSKQLEAAKLQYIAARDPSEEGRYVAAMHFAGLQILVISAKYAAPALLNEKLISSKYQDIYVDLSSASERASRIIIEDLRANGIARSKQKDQPPDVYEAAGKKIVFDFDWRKQKLTEEEYFKTLETADAQYTRILGLLLEQAKQAK